MVSESAPGAAGVHLATTLPRAASAASGSAWRTATRPSWFTTVTPGSPAAAAVSTLSRVAPWAGGRRTFA